MLPSTKTWRIHLTEAAAMRTEKRGEAGAGMQLWLCFHGPILLAVPCPIPPGPSSALGRLIFGIQRDTEDIPAQHGIHHSYSDVHSPERKVPHKSPWQNGVGVRELLIKFEICYYYHLWASKCINFPLMEIHTHTHTQKELRTRILK